VINKILMALHKYLQAEGGNIYYFTRQRNFSKPYSIFNLVSLRSFEVYAALLDQKSPVPHDRRPCGQLVTIRSSVLWL
jgi:hypothetical protein